MRRSSIQFLRHSFQVWALKTHILCSPVLEEVLQGLADGVPLLNGQQVLQLLSEGAAVNTYTGRQDLRHPLQGAEHWGAGAFRGNASPNEVRLREGEAGRTVLHYQSGHGTAALEHGHHLLMGGGPTGRQKVHIWDPVVNFHLHELTTEK